MKDAEYWRRVYYLHSKTTAFQNKVKRSEEIIRRFMEVSGLNLADICSTCSAGKDSTAMSFMATSILKGIKVVSEKDDMDFPGELIYIHRLKEDYGWSIDIISPSVKLWDVIVNHTITEDIHSQGSAFSDRYFYDVMREYQRSNGIKGVLLGLRSGESRRRLWNFKVKGHTYYNKQWQQWVCQPLVLWSARDVFAYLVCNDVPIFDIYFKTRFVESPEIIRKSWILPSSQSSQGQVVWLKYYYPDIFARLCCIKPELRCYV